MNASPSLDVDAPTTSSEVSEDVVVVQLANCLAQIVGELNALKTLVHSFDGQFERKIRESEEAFLKIDDGGGGVFVKRENGVAGEESDNFAAEERADSSASEEHRKLHLRTYNNDNNNSSAVPNKNESVSEKDKENACHQFGNLASAYRAIDGKVVTELISLMLACEVFVTDTQLNRWKKKQCTEVFYIPMKSGEHYGSRRMWVW